MSLLDQIENHEALVVATDKSGMVRISQEDFRELCYLAHQALHPESAPVMNDHIRHPWDVAREAFDDRDPEESDESTEYDRGYDQARDDHNRQYAVAYATQVVTAAIQAAHGLESTSPKVEVLAQGIYAFLTGEK